MESKAKIRINLATREFEIEGSEEFINSHSDKIESFLEILKKTPSAPIQSEKISSAHSASNGATATANNGSVPETFGEYVLRLPKNSKDVDKMLIAGHFLQSNNPEGTFTTNDANAILIEQGIKLSNPSLAVTRNNDSKRVIKISKGVFKLSREGVDHLNSVLGNKAASD